MASDPCGEGTNRDPCQCDRSSQGPEGRASSVRSASEKVRVLDWIVRELGESFPGQAMELTRYRLTADAAEVIEEWLR